VLARACTFALDGVAAVPVWAEVDVRPGLPNFAIVGLGDASVREARQRVQAALGNSGFKFPQQRVTANLAPAYLRKAGPGFDLAIACALLAAIGEVDSDALAGVAVFGELSLSGEVRGCRGTLAVAEGARAAGLGGLVVAADGAREAALVEGLRVAAVPDLTTTVAVLRGADAPPASPPPRAARNPTVVRYPDLADVRGHDQAVEAIVIAAAGGHNLLLCGPPGTGKTMLARRLPSILPPLSRAEAVEVTRIHSIAGLYEREGLVERRPFRAPHHTISAAGLVGGGAVPTPGEATLAHHGVLFLDELSEFARPALEALRQPLEDGRVVIVRGQQTAIYPTDFMLVAATNPCPCGFAGLGQRCRCTEADLARHRRRLSGPLLDRLDLLVHVTRPELEPAGRPAGTTSAQARDRIAGARERQARRLGGTGAECNARMSPALVRDRVGLTAQAADTLADAYRRGELSARGHTRLLRVARTIADLDGSDDVLRPHMLKALSLRQDIATALEGAA
jgi:magnesium chelatase family protein